MNSVKEILDKFAVRFLWLVGFTCAVLLLGGYVLVWIHQPWAAFGITLAVVWVLCFGWAVERDLDISWLPWRN